MQGVHPSCLRPWRLSFPKRFRKSVLRMNKAVSPLTHVATDRPAPYLASWLQLWPPRARHNVRRPQSLAERIQIRDAEITRFKADKEFDKIALRSLEIDKARLEKDLFRTQGFRTMLALEEGYDDDDEPREEVDPSLEFQGHTPERRTGVFPARKSPRTPTRHRARSPRYGVGAILGPF